MAEFKNFIRELSLLAIVRILCMIIKDTANLFHFIEKRNYLSGLTYSLWKLNHEKHRNGVLGVGFWGLVLLYHNTDLQAAI
jgi:hypothetical protein